MTKRFGATVVLGLVLAVAACPGNDEERINDLTAFELEHGIGPFETEVELGPVDLELAAQGESAYEMLCESCHRLEDRFVGPPLGDVLERRSPTFVLNMIMNPEEMTRRHPVGQQLLAEYLLVMPYQGVTEQQARAILEYLRTVN